MHDPHNLDVREVVRLRANDACEYCLLPTISKFEVEHVVPPRLWDDYLAGRLSGVRPRRRRQGPDHRIKDRDRQHLQPPAALLQQMTKGIVDQSEEHDPRIGLDTGDDPVDLAAGAHHAPNMFNGLGVVELHETCPSH